VSRILTCEIAAALAVFSMGSVLSQPAAATTPADNLFTTYGFEGPNQISWITCGSTAQSSACFDAGTLGNLNNACDIMEGPPTLVSSTPSQYFVARHVFVMNADGFAAPLPATEPMTCGARQDAHRRSDPCGKHAMTARDIISALGVKDAHCNDWFWLRGARVGGVSRGFRT
jgi:hypothetical protein